MAKAVSPVLGILTTEISKILTSRDTGNEDKTEKTDSSTHGKNALYL